MSKKVYIRAKSKNDINDMIARDVAIGTHYGIASTDTVNLRSLDKGDVVVRYTKTAGGNPIGEGYFQYDPGKKKVK